MTYTIMLPPRPEVVAEVGRYLGRPNRHLFVFARSEDDPGRPAACPEPQNEFRLQDYDPAGVPQVSADTLPDKVALLLAYSCCGSDVGTVEKCLWGVERIKSEVAVPVLRVALERHREDRSYLWIMTALIKSGAVDLVDRAARELAAGRAGDDRERYDEEGVARAIAEAVGPDSWRTLAPLVSHPNVLVRRAVFERLREMRLPESAPELAAGLDDTDLHVQYLAGMTLVEIWKPPGDLAPGVGVFAEEREKCVEAWKALAREHGVYPPRAR